MTRQTQLHNWTVPTDGDSDYEETFDRWFTALDESVEIRDKKSNLSNYYPVDGQKFYAIDTEEVFIGDGMQWVKRETSGKNPTFNSVDANMVTTDEIYPTAVDESVVHARKLADSGSGTDDEPYINAIYNSFYNHDPTPKVVYLTGGPDGEAPVFEERKVINLMDHVVEYDRGAPGSSGNAFTMPSIIGPAGNRKAVLLKGGNLNDYPIQYDISATSLDQSLNYVQSKISGIYYNGNKDNSSGGGIIYVNSDTTKVGRFVFEDMSLRYADDKAIKIENDGGHKSVYRNIDVRYSNGDGADVGPWTRVRGGNYSHNAGHGLNTVGQEFDIGGGVLGFRNDKAAIMVNDPDGYIGHATLKNNNESQNTWPSIEIASNIQKTKIENIHASSATGNEQAAITDRGVETRVSNLTTEGSIQRFAFAGTRPIEDGEYARPPTVDLNGTNQNISPADPGLREYDLYITSSGGAAELYGIDGIAREGVRVTLQRLGSNTVQLNHNDTNATNALFNQSGTDVSLGGKATSARYRYDGSQWLMEWVDN